MRNFWPFNFFLPPVQEDGRSSLQRHIDNINPENGDLVRFVLGLDDTIVPPTRSLRHAPNGKMKTV